MGNNTDLTAEEFLREKLESEITSFGDGTTEFHTRDIEHLLKCLEEKDDRIEEQREKINDLRHKVNFDAEAKLSTLLEECMTKSNWSAEERLSFIRHKYASLWKELNSK